MFIGTAKIGHINWRSGIADVGIMIGEKKYWGKGLGTEVVNLITKYAFDYLSLRKLVAGTNANNIGMCKCFFSNGFKKEGTWNS